MYSIFTSLHNILQQDVGSVLNQALRHEHSALSRTYNKCWYLRHCCILLLLPATYRTGLFVLSQAFFLHAKMHLDRSSTVKTTNLSKKSTSFRGSATTLCLKIFGFYLGNTHIHVPQKHQGPGARASQSRVFGYLHNIARMFWGM